LITRAPLKNSQMVQPPPISCRGAGLTAWSPETHLNGLIVDGGVLQLDAKSFPCCFGTGVEILDFDGKTVSRNCGITQRLSWVLELCDDILKTQTKISISQLLCLPAKANANNRHSEQKNLLKGLSHWRNVYLSRIRENKRGAILSPKATMTSVGGGETMSPHWAAWASVVWHDAVRPLVFVHGSGVPPISKWVQDLQRSRNQSSPYPALIFVEGVKNLWDAFYLEQLEQIIFFASQTNTPLWLNFKSADGDAEDVAASGPSKSDSSLKFSSKITTKMQNFRRGSIEKWLSASSLDRLRGVCDLPTPAK